MSPYRVIHFAAHADDTTGVDDLTECRPTLRGPGSSPARATSAPSSSQQDDRTGADVLDDPTFRAAVERTLAGTPVLVPDQRCTPSSEPDPNGGPDVVPPPWNDLVGNVPRVDAERQARVASALERLGPRWRCLHAVPVGPRDACIGHLLLGPGGVFTINAKQHPDATLWVDRDTLVADGQRWPYVRRSRLEATWACGSMAAAATVPVPRVVGVVVVSAPGVVSVSRQPRDGRVWVLAEDELVDWLLQLPETLGDAEVARLHAVARRVDTWREGWSGS